MRSTRLCLALLAGLAIGATCRPGSAQAGFTFTLEPEGGVVLTNLQVGQTINLDLNVSGFDPGSQISYFRITESLGGTLFQLLGIAAGNAIPGPGFSSNGSPSSFSVAYSGATPITSPGTLAVVTLMAVGVGSGDMTLTSPSYFGPPTADPGNFTGMNQHYNISTSVTTAIVPEPSSLVLGLIASALGCLGWRSRCWCRPRQGFGQWV